VGHGRRRKQAHDEYHDWIGIRRGRCTNCETTFTFLPVFSLPYTHYSLLARCQALQHRFAEGCSWEKALPQLKDADRVPDASTVRRWSRGLDVSHLAVSLLLHAMAWVAHWLELGKQSDAKAGPLPWMVSALEVVWPLRL
jgi:ferric-dicitrate binding protein FerR (iron transport regulator)